MSMEQLVGKTIEKLSLSRDATVIVFHTREAGDIAYEAEGDCCSESWFADILGVEHLIGTKITHVEDVFAEIPAPDDKRGVPDKDGKPSEDRDVQVMYGIRLDSGSWNQALIIFRNDSNGYYGGSIRVTTEIPADLREITEDVSA